MSLVRRLALVVSSVWSADVRDVVRSGVRLAGSFEKSEYYNQPQAVQLSNGSWVVMLTNAGHTEGQVNQRVVSRLHVSPNLTEGEWLPEVNIEAHAYGPSAGWVVPVYAEALERLYAIYTYNAGNITHMPDGSVCACQLVGGQFMKYSDDFGETWSDRHEIPIRSTAGHTRVLHCYFNVGV